MRGLEAIGLIRAFEREHPALRPAVLIMCTGAALDAEAGWEENGEHTDACWTKPFPDFTDNTMQRMLSELLRKRPHAAAPSSAPADRSSSVHA